MHIINISLPVISYFILEIPNQKKSSALQSLARDTVVASVEQEIF